MADWLALSERIGFCLRMSKRYRPWKIDEPMLLPATVQEFVTRATWRGLFCAW